jgi:hypothetical protein
MSLIPKPQPRQALRNSPLDETVGPRVVTRQLREVFREAFDQLGGASWLVEFATANDQNARVFVQAISKLLPASASPTEAGDRITIDVPWLTRERLSYREEADQEARPLGSDVITLLPREPKP